eukprot:CAMPEP_0179259300 /NCGR_PEP_ID=MMETSP0797-20121207/25754_1 /TAXON_ID=47934 /ORGANISM="Dinophysis acuminata, Strain DAEP01" /LENGTH=267 /DNA_ID=CAMNT_0020967347 /DNA_START=64 /DNA_END=868 /DNA_ORIENTATION=-
MSQKGSNPFESAFSLLKGLRDQIHELQAALVQEQQLRARQVDELKSQVMELKKASAEDRATHGDATRAVKVALGEHASRLASGTEEFKAAVTGRVEKLESALDVEVFDRKQTDQSFTKRTNSEAQQWRAKCDKIERELQDHKAVYDLQGSSVKRRHQELREDVEKLADLLRNNSLSADPFVRDFCTNLSEHIPPPSASQTGTTCVPGDGSPDALLLTPTPSNPYAGARAQFFFPAANTAANAEAACDDGGRRLIRGTPRVRAHRVVA